VDSTRLRSGTRSSRPGSGHARRGRLNSRPTRGRGEMADARVLEARGEIRAGSSPVARISSTDRRAPWGRRGCREVGPSSPVARTTQHGLPGALGTSDDKTSVGQSSRPHGRMVRTKARVGVAVADGVFALGPRVFARQTAWLRPGVTTGPIAWEMARIPARVARGQNTGRGIGATTLRIGHPRHPPARSLALGTKHP
jgi:hypothetical protein